MAFKEPVCCHRRAEDIAGKAVRLMLHHLVEISIQAALIDGHDAPFRVMPKKDMSELVEKGEADPFPWCDLLVVGDHVPSMQDVGHTVP